MKKWIPGLLLLMLLAGCAQPVPETPIGPPAETEAPETPPEAAFPTPEDVLAELCSAGYAGRLVGSAGNVRAAEYIAGLMADLGLEPLDGGWLQPYEDRLGHPDRVQTVAALHDGAGGSAALTWGTDFSCSFPGEDVALRLPVSRDPAACEGGAAVLWTEELSEASTFVMDHPERAALVCVEDLAAAGPNDWVSQTGSGLRLELDAAHRPLLERPGAELELSVKAGAETGTAYNVAAVLPGSEGKSAFVIGAHFDGSGQAGEVLFPSAYDNASGTAALLETARLLRDAELVNDVVFVAFNGEERGKDGSAAIAPALAERYERIAMVNIDCVGLRDAAGLGVYDESAANGALQAALLALLEGAEPAGSYSSDQRSFESFENVSAVALADLDVTESGALHLPADTPDRLDGAVLEQAAAAVAALVRADVIYESAAPEEGEPDDGLTAQQRDLRRQLNADGILSKFGQVYVYDYNAGEKCYEAITGVNRLLLSPAEIREACPKTDLPERIGDYGYVAAQLGARWEAARIKIYTLTASLAGDYEVGRVYDFSGTLTADFIDALYRAEDGTGLELIVQPGAWTPEEDWEDAGTLDPALAGVWVQHEVYPEQGVDGYRSFCYNDAGGAMVLGWFSDLSENGDPVTGFEDLFDYTRGRIRWLTAEETVAQLRAIGPELLKRLAGSIETSDLTAVN